MRKTTYNSTYKKLAVQWLNEALCFVLSSVLADSFRLRNRKLLVAAKRYGQVLKNDTTEWHRQENHQRTTLIALKEYIVKSKNKCGDRRPQK